jgi:predicted Zn-dependent protease
VRASAGQGNQGYARFFSEQINLARQEFEIGRADKAFEIWRRIRVQFPDLCLASEKAVSLFVDIASKDEAEALIQEGRGRYPRYRSIYAAALARVSYRQGDLAMALRRYEVVRRKFPRVADGYSVAAACLGTLGRHDEAEAMLARGVRKLPGNVDLFMLHARAATRRLDWSEGLRRWNLVSKQFGYLQGPLGAAQCLREMERGAEAENVLIEACARFEGIVYPFADLAGLSTAKGDFAEAARRWNSVLMRFPGHEPAYLKAAEALRETAREAESDEVLRAGMTRFPANRAINLECARNAHRRGDRATARERWALVHERFPDCAEARDQDAAARAEMGEPRNTADATNDRR